ncbi:GNAT family N-acetyltransferase [Streptococcus thermophilus]|uniref:GNAT family N-acetyltransferase n=1 Tax=Streptococcus thermophilus TaxID=1308 RepID=UPI001108DD00|nr:GNAT family N-acetyltransferase [Streptococcus thermophilus]MBO1148361.1 GNAT family N-acetyltransferase [Streptococcus thermophilus]MBO1156509.1 GNAT family N-acetyltransferase [Streptococcus thermophilus]MBO1158065.1 GNAT family N-acetyltransferase [Streptococcus thermophilus]MBO1159705.1 GNAT family N-acetyltransferase [Streptococcus thermophilus]MBO1161447.1 GNAT family N-acetyltransferase [Streptococcus thermophilus]
MEKVSIKEIEQLTELFHTAYSNNEKLGIHFKAATISSEEVEDHWLGQPMFTEKADGKIVTTASLRLPWSKNPSPFALPHLGWVATHPDYQGRSLARMLIEEVIDEFVIKKLRAPAITLGTALEHPWLIKAYEKLGFVYLSEKQLFSDHKTVYMIKILDKKALLNVNDKELQDLIKENVNEF